MINYAKLLPVVKPDTIEHIQQELGLDYLSGVRKLQEHFAVIRERNPVVANLIESRLFSALSQAGKEELLTISVMVYWSLEAQAEADAMREAYG